MRHINGKHKKCHYSSMETVQNKYISSPEENGLNSEFEAKMRWS